MKNIQQICKSKKEIIMKNRKYLDLKNKYFYNTFKRQNVTSPDHYKIIL